MKRTFEVFGIALANLAWLCVAACAQVESMKLLTPEVGWAANRQRLVWTNTGGKEWAEITPKRASAGEHIEAVFFLDTSTGWVLWSDYAEPQPRFDLSATTNSGASWTSVHIPITVSSVAVPLSENARIYFLDAVHGWINVTVQGSASAHPGAMLATGDGGSTWKWMGMVSRGDVYFGTPDDGWIASPEGDEFAATHDGAKTWQDVTLLPPPAAEVRGDYNTTYHLPTLQDSLHGYLEVEFSYGSEFSAGARSVRILFVTDDGGRTWKFNRKMPDVTLTQFASSKMETGSDAAASEVTDNLWVAASVRGRKTLDLTQVRLDPGQVGTATMRVDVGKYPDLYGLRYSEQISFIDPLHGWVLPGRLLATNDGGSTWAEISPSQLMPPARPTISVPAKPQLIPNKPRAGVGGVRPEYKSPSGTDVSIHLGFGSSGRTTEAQ